MTAASTVVAAALPCTATTQSVAVDDVTVILEAEGRVDDGGQRMS